MKFEKCCGCIILNEDKVLLVKHNVGHWGFPKGHMEENETELQTAIRETKEETNLDVEVQEEKRYVDEYYSSEDTFKQVVYFLATCKNMNVKKQEAEIAQIEWVPIEEAGNKITYENTKKLFKQVLEEYFESEIIL